ncbi:peptide deformylase [Spirulina sp. 06S082]|uniref:peptide deformylase n=1 Tax=Spirulina sp. 06S082 TaxID=3110248 RepID=UPI002B20A24B|nr:peptide deformylase [Spirulina sp. 06S082]MEA5468430.1 peptide deformylase [Spirulina sp. 06S082]
MSELLDIARLGHSILRQQAQVVKDVTESQIQVLIDNLIATAAAAKGVGIAAPQVSQSYRLFIIASRPSDRYPYAPTMQPTAMINPRILAASEAREKDWEGCLSVPGVRGLVPRSQEIEVEYGDRRGHLQKTILTDFVARIFQHELDHLNGILFIDRLESSEDRFTEKEYQTIIRKR